MLVLVLQQPADGLFVPLDHPFYVLQHRSLPFVRLRLLLLSYLEDALRQARWLELPHRQVEQIKVHQKKRPLFDLHALASIFRALPELEVQEVIERIVGQLEIERPQHLSLEPDDLCLLPVVDPISQVGRVYFLVLHGNEEAGLRHRYHFNLIFEGISAGKVEIHVVDCQEERAPEEGELLADLDDVAD